MTLAEKLIKLRNEKKMSQKAIAEQLGIHYNSYARFERGISTPRSSTYDKLAEVYGCTKEYLLDVDDKKKAPAKASASKDVKKAQAAEGAEKKQEAAKGAEKKAEAPKDKKTAAKNAKKAPAAKTAGKKSSKPSGSAKEAKKDAPEKKEPVVAAKAAPPINIELQYAGKNISYSDIIEMAKAASGSDGEEMDIYIKPEEDRVYYVVKGVPGSFEI